MRALALVLSAALLNSCLWINPERKAQVSPTDVDLNSHPSMVQRTMAGAVRVDSVVYKPKVLPLSTFLKRLANGDIKGARRVAPFKYKRSNVDDRALRALVKKGFIPVYVQATNLAEKPVDLQGLRLALDDSSLTLAPIPNDELPEELKSLNGKGLAADTYNAAVVVGSAIVVLAAAAILDKLQGKITKKETHENRERAKNEIADSVGGHLIGEPAEHDDVDMTFDPGNPIFNPLIKTTTIDYNGLLFSPRALAPGESAKGLLFFKARGVDWSALNLQASLAQ